MYSRRFQRKIILAEHARRRMAERRISPETLLELVETGEVRYTAIRRIAGSPGISTNATTTCCALRRRWRTRWS